MTRTGKIRTLSAGLILACVAQPLFAKEQTKSAPIRLGSENWQVVLKQPDWEAQQSSPVIMDREKSLLVAKPADMAPSAAAPAKPALPSFTYLKRTKNLMLTISFEATPALATAEDCQKAMARKVSENSALGLLDPVSSVRSKVPVQEYSLSIPIRDHLIQRNVLSCRFRGTYLIHTHASKMDYHAPDYKELMAVIDSVAITDAPKK